MLHRAGRLEYPHVSMTTLRGPMCALCTLLFAISMAAHFERFRKLKSVYTSEQGFCFVSKNKEVF